MRKTLPTVFVPPAPELRPADQDEQRRDPERRGRRSRGEEAGTGRPGSFLASRANATAATISRIRKNDNEASTSARIGSFPMPGSDARQHDAHRRGRTARRPAALIHRSQPASRWNWLTRLSVRTGRARNAANAAIARRSRSAGTNRTTVEAAKTTNTARNTATTARADRLATPAILADRDDQGCQVREVQREREDVGERHDRLDARNAARDSIRSRSSVSMSAVALDDAGEAFHQLGIELAAGIRGELRDDALERPSGRGMAGRGSSRRMHRPG